MMQRRKFTEWLLHRGASSPVGQYEYSNAGYGIAAAMAERCTGESYESLMRERLFKRIGMKSAGFGWPAQRLRNEPWGHREQGDQFIPHSPKDKYQLPPIIAPAGDIHINITDFARFAQLHLAGLTGQPRLLKTETFKKLHGPFGDYSLGWNVIQVHGFPASFHSGSAGTFYGGVMIYAHKNVAVVIAINASGQKVDVARNKLFNLLLSKYSQKD
jgi:CubicO group peptidase (beta-lactamase class C family)